jgi:hypothetical protein
MAIDWKLLISVVLVHKRTIPTEKPPLAGEVSANILGIEGVVWSAQRIPTAVNLGFLDPKPLLFHLSSWVDPVPDPLLLRKCGRERNRTLDLWICSQKLWPLDHRGGLENYYRVKYFLKKAP